MAYIVFILSGLLATAAVYGVAIGWLWFRQERLLFEPSPLPDSDLLSTDPDVCELFMDVPGARLCVAHLHLPSPRGVVFYLHGNSGNLQKWLIGLETFHDMNFDLVMFDYRGFGKSTGRIESEAQLRADVRAVWARFAPQYDGLRVVIAGQSLGTALAAGLSAELCADNRAPALTLMVSPYSSMRALADERYPWVPSKVLRYPLATLDHVGRLTGPLMLIHGDQDKQIGFHHSEALHRAAPGAQLLCIKGAGHGDVHQFLSYRQGIAAALGCL